MCECSKPFACGCACSVPRYPRPEPCTLVAPTSDGARARSCWRRPLRASERSDAEAYGEISFRRIASPRAPLGTILQQSKSSIGEAGHPKKGAGRGV